MLRSAWIFLAAILLPSLVLAWLAVRSARDQQVLLEHQQAIISQDVTDSLAKNVRSQIDTMRSEFVQITQDLLGKSTTPQAMAYDFDRRLREQWLPAEVGFAVDLHGAIYSPSRDDGMAGRTFRDENERFLSNRENVEVYSSLKSQNLVTKQLVPPSKPSGGSSQTDMQAGFEETRSVAQPLTTPPPAPNASPEDALLKNSPKAASASSSLTATPGAKSQAGAAMPDSASSLQDTKSSEDKSRSIVTADSAKAAGDVTSTPSLADMPRDQPAIAPPPAPGTPAPASLDSPATASQFTSRMAQKTGQVARQVNPQNNFDIAAALSNTVPEESDFRRLIGDDTSGALARFLDNKLRLMVWSRPSATSDLVFGAQLNQAQLLERLRSVLQAPELKERDSGLISRSHAASYCLALLDDMGHPVALSIRGFKADWKHPFVATEIGETLPHWEAALYLTDPQQMSKSARTLRLTVSLIVLLLIVAIVAGGSLIATDIRRQVRAAQQKTDFVSNVSHELKTPLTSIRMFADLLAEGRVTEPERQLTYLKIISAESARLTRLINNVLDFARQERGAPNGERRPCDLVETTRDVVETCLPHLEAGGQNLSCEIEAETLPIVGDRDALAQIVLNLISNAEKYGGGEIIVRIRQQETSTGALGCVDVLDRGPGIPPKQVESVFLPFHRLHDSLSNGIPGSGLGLTLARRMARVHGGDITYTPRAGGGSCFTLTVPLIS
jgi:signal transduction histidine kinase